MTRKRNTVSVRDLNGLDEEVPVVGINVTFCDDEPMYAHLAAEKLKLATHTKQELEAAILDAAAAGWRVAIRCHCSETGRHGAKLFRAGAASKGRQGRKAAVKPLR